MEIRKAKQEDAERIIDINIEVWNTTYKNLISQEIIDKLQYKNEERIDKSKKRIKEKNNTYVALVNGEIVVLVHMAGLETIIIQMRVKYMQNIY